GVGGARRGVGGRAHQGLLVGMAVFVRLCQAGGAAGEDQQRGFVGREVRVYREDRPGGVAAVVLERRGRVEFQQRRAARVLGQRARRGGAGAAGGGAVGASGPDQRRQFAAAVERVQRRVAHAGRERGECGDDALGAVGQRRGHDAAARHALLEFARERRHAQAEFAVACLPSAEHQRRAVGRARDRVREQVGQRGGGVQVRRDLGGLASAGGCLHGSSSRPVGTWQIGMIYNNSGGVESGGTQEGGRGRG